MTRMFKRGIAVLAMSVMLLCLGAVPAFAATTLDVVPAAGSDAFRIIQDALDEAKAKATDSNPYTVRVVKGSYQLGTGLRIYGNTTLRLDGVTLTMQKGRDGNIIKVGDAGNVGSQGDRQKGYYYKNVAIMGER